MAKKAATPKAAKPKRPRGRPTTFSQEAADEICQRIATGEPLAVICRDEKMPAYRTVYDWMAAHPDFSASIARARDEGYDSIAADCLAIADDRNGDVKLVGRSDGETAEVCNTEFVQRAKLRIETRLKLLAKWDPKRYGDKVALVGGNPETGDEPVRVDLTALKDDQIRALASIKLPADRG